MKFKLFATAFAVSFALTSCDSGSSSSDANEAVFDNSNPGQEQLATEVEKDSAKVEKDSSSTEKSADKGKTSTDTTEDVKVVKSNDGSNININGEGLSAEQIQILRSLEAKMGDLDEGGSATPVSNGECENGEVQTGVCMGQNVQWTCLYGDWIPTAGFDKVIEAIPSEDLNDALAGSGLTKEDLLAMLNMLSNMDASKSNADVVCEGDLTDNFWKMNMTGNFAGINFLMKGDVTFEGDSMITNSVMEMDYGSESLCESYLNTDDDEDDEDDLDKELYGDVVKSESKCNGSRLVQVEKLVKKGVTDASRKSVYDDMISPCKDYRDGKISFEELMVD
jgi:hypothetical protein